MSSPIPLHHLAVMHIIVVTAAAIFYPTLAASQPYRNITKGSSIVAGGKDDTAVFTSPSGDFAFGFRPASPAGYLLAIWFDKIPEKTIVWSANRDSPSIEGSKLQLFSDGRFVLADPRGSTTWAADIPGTGVAYGALLDSGNLVLANNASTVLWQSFDEPTDTLLPTQTLERGAALVSAFSDKNFSSGRFTFVMQSDGNLVLYPRNFPLGGVFPSTSYWSTDTFGSGYRVGFNQSGYITLSAQNGSVLSRLSSNGAPSGELYQRFVLEYDGVLRHYVYPKSTTNSPAATGGRPAAWSVVVSLPSDVCLAVTQDTGPGACGLNSYCSMGMDQRPTCNCPTGYVRIDPTDPLSGCKPDFPQQICGEEERDAGLYTFLDLPNTDWPRSDYEYFRPVEEDWCRRACLLDCFCAVAIYRDRNCWKKRFPLSHGKLDSSVGGKALVKVSVNASAANGGNNNDDSGGSNNKSRDRSVLIIAGAVLLGGSVLLNLIAASYGFFFGFGPKVKKSKTDPSQSVLPWINLRSFSYQELEEATEGFKTELGSGACSTVFKGTLAEEDGRPIAVKKLDKLPKDADQEFRAEVRSISATNHKNLVRLLGYCDEGQNRLLVYEFMPNGSLADHLFDKKPNWHSRVQIAYATARGLLYLHEECTTPIIHCDIKPQNVLLDAAMAPKISDFGLAKLLRPDQTRTTTGIRGTRGYVAPEWFKNGPVTAKVDVYSFGILFLEILCCRRHVEVNVGDERMVILADYAYDCYREGALRCLLASDDEEALRDMERFEKLAMVALWCVQEDSSLRPSMKRVVQMLEGSVSVPSPPDPSSFNSLID